MGGVGSSARGGVARAGARGEPRGPCTARGRERGHLGRNRPSQGGREIPFSFSFPISKSILLSSFFIISFFL
jgi:hypothetical protein